jgi:hypothetical protein
VSGWLSRRVSGRRRPPGEARSAVAVGDPRYDDWEVVREFEELNAAKAWHQHLQERGVTAVLTSDWPLDRFDRGDIALRVPPGLWSESGELLGETD